MNKQMFAFKVQITI